MDARPGEEPPFLVRTRAPRAGLGRRVIRAARLLVMVFLPLLLLAGALAGFAYMQATRPTVPVERQPEQPRLVDAIAAERADLRPTLSLFGEVVSGRSVDLRALVAGEIISVSDQLVEGGRVSRNDELARIDPFAFEGALVRANADLAETDARIAELDARVRQEEAGIARAREQLAITEREIARLRTLTDRGAAPERQLDDALLRLSQAESALEGRESQIAVFEAQRDQLAAARARLEFGVAQARRNLDDTVLRAPFDALITSPQAEEGKLVGSNDRIATLVAVDRLEARFALSDSQYARLASRGEVTGNAVSVIWRAGDNVVERPATVTRIAPQVADASFAAFAEIAIDDTALEVLRPGTFVEVAMPDRLYEDTILLPADALYENSVFLIVEERLQRVPVTVRAFAAEGVVVEGEIPDGALVLTSRLSAAATGQLVEVRE
ncbi:MAG: HlyD family efflux transporter periplasmic adaptor subunit [Salinarimonas sp.]|nr:HlyD family efflux transporter periplasmic adaptor subunit [Salinarimonas sp.]